MMNDETCVERYVCHSRRVLALAERHGWRPGARYTNLRDVRHVDRLGFLDIHWQNYSFDLHAKAAATTNPCLTVARDIERVDELNRILDQASALAEHADRVVIVPKAPELAEGLTEHIPEQFILGYSVPTRYGGTEIPLGAFGRRPVHLLGGRPDVQRKLADRLNVVSLDTNRFTLDAAYGDYFDGETFRPHPEGGYERCLEASLENMNALWTDYGQRA